MVFEPACAKASAGRQEAGAKGPGATTDTGGERRAAPHPSAREAHKRWAALINLRFSSFSQSSVLLQSIPRSIVEGRSETVNLSVIKNFLAQARLGVSKEEHEAFFRKMLGDVDEPTTPFGLTDVRGDGSGIAEARRQVDASLARRLRACARSFGVSAASVCHVAWAQVLARMSGRDDVVFGTVLFGQMQGGAGADRAQGLFINTLPIRIKVGEDGVQDSVRHTHALLGQLQRHEHAPLALAQRCSAVAASGLLFSAILNYHHGAAAAETRQIWDGIESLGEEERTNYPLTLSVGDLGEEFSLLAQAHSPVDPQRVCAYMHTALERLVEALERAPATPLHKIDVLPESERHQLLVEWNRTEVACPKDRCLHEFIEDQAERTRAAVAVIFENTSLTYGQLNERANQLAHYLRKHGVGPDVLVGVCMERSIEMVVALLGTMKAGGAYVPFDPDYPPERLAVMLEDAAPPVMLTQEHLASRIPDGHAVILRLDSGWPVFANESRTNPSPVCGPANGAYAIYTSGSTGKPKGVLNVHEGIVNRLLWMQDAYKLTSADRVLQKTPYSFDVSVWEFFWPLMTGASLVVARPGGHKEPDYLVDVIEAQNISTLHFVPSMLNMFLEARGLQRCSSLKRVIVSGEALPVPTQERFFARLGAELHNLYGPTEASVDVTYWPCRGEETRTSVPIGWPVANTQIYILDARLNPVPIGISGELHIGGIGLARGYLNRPELTAEKFIPDPFSNQPGARLYKTGDLARYAPDGSIEYVGRLDSQIKLRGFRIELGEIEAVCRNHPGVDEAAVLVKERSPGEKSLVGYVVPDPLYAGPLRQMLRLTRENRTGDRRPYELPNGMTIFPLNKAEADFQYQEIFEHQSYLKHGVRLDPGACVFDVGANVGMFTLFVHRVCPDAVVYAFEPIPPVHELLALNAEVFGVKGKMFDCGLSDMHGSAEFSYFPNLSILSSRFAEVANEREVVKRYLENDGVSGPLPAGLDQAAVEELLNDRLGTRQVVCSLTTISRVIREQQISRIDLLKIDVEKSEELVLGGIDDEHWDAVRQIVIEVHDIDGRLERLRDKLIARGYNVHSEEDSSLKGTGLHQIYAIHSSMPPSAAPSPVRELGWSAANRLAGDLRSFLREKLPEYMIPSDFVVLEQFPISPNGKVDRKALSKARGASAELKKAVVEPRTPIERALVEIWCALLGVKEIGIHDNFFDLGGHSLLAVSLLEGMRQAGLHTDVRTLFATPTVAALAVAVGGASGVVDVPPNRIPPTCVAITPDMLPLVQLTPGHIERVVAAVPGGAANVQDIYPLAPLQEGILFHHLMASEGDRDPYLLSALFGFESRDRLQQYLQALQSVIDRHDCLRTAALWEGLPEPVQVVWRQARLAVEEIGITADDVAQQLRAGFALRHYRLDLRQAPLIRVFIAHDEANARWVMLQLFHHFSIDHTTIDVVRAEIQAHLLGRAEQLPAPLPFRNFVAQARLGISKEEHEAFFRKMLGDVDEPTTPFGLTDVRGDGSGIAEARRQIDASLARRLRARARLFGVSAASVCHLAWAQVLARMSGRDDVVFGTVLFGRMQGGAGADRALGLFINTLPIRIKVGGDSVQDSVRHTHALLGQLLRHEHAPLALAQRCSAVAASGLLFSAILNYHHGAAASEARQIWDGIESLGEEERTNYPLTLSVGDLGEEFSLLAQAHSPVDPQRVCAYMHTALEQLVEALERAPATPLCQLDVLPESERHQLLVEWNDTARDFPQDKCAHQLFEEQVARSPEAVAVACNHEQLTYADLNCRAERLAVLLRALGVGPEEMVGLFVERSVEIVVGLLGILKSGGAYVPLDPLYPGERLTFMLDDTQIRVVVTQQRLVSVLPKPTQHVVLLDEDDASDATPNLLPVRRPSAGNLAYVIYTSGSTGQPKGVMVTHRNLVHSTSARLHFYQEPVSSYLLVSSFSFDSSVAGIFWTLAQGGCLVLPPTGAEGDPECLTDLIVRRRVSHVLMLPSLYGLILEQSRIDQFASLRVTIVAGEACPGAVVDRHRRRLPNAALFNEYGPTEGTVWCTACRIDGGSSRPQVSIGRPIPNMHCYILDQQCQPVGVCATGEIYIGGAGIARGYLNRLELTAERFIRDPFSDDPDGRLYRTGDLARWLPDGNIEFMGRMDHQVKIRGYRIELGEIESALGGHPDLAACAVVARGDDGGNKALAAFVVSRTHAEPSVGSLRQFLAEKLPEYMIPSRFVGLDALPLTTNGKVDRKALEKLDGVELEAGAEYVAPRNEMESRMVEIWQTVLRRERVGVHDNFFDLGGHSLLAVSVQARVENALGARLSLAAFFQAPTVSELANLMIDPGEPRHGLYMTGSGALRDKPPLFCLHSLTSAQRLGAMPLRNRNQVVCRT